MEHKHLDWLITYHLLITSICLYLAMIANNELIQSKTTKTAGIMQYISDNLREPPIEDILRVVPQDPCPKGFNPMTLGHWYGTYKGSYRDAGHNVRVREHDPVTLINWKEMKFCTRRYEDFHYDFNGNCGSGYKFCGETFCVREKQKCPITKISIEKIPETLTSSTKSIYTSNTILLFERTESTPIYAIQTSNNAKPCYASGYSYYKSNFYSFLRDLNGCLPYGKDDEAMIIDEMMELAFYQQNQLEQTIDELPDYVNTIKHDRTFLVTRPKLTLKKSTICQQNKSKDIDFLTPGLEMLECEKNVAVLNHLLLLPLMPSLYCIVTRKMRMRIPHQNYSYIIRGTIVSTCLLSIGALLISWRLAMGTLALLESYSAEEQYFSNLVVADCFLQKVFATGIKDYLASYQVLKELKWVSIWLLFGIFLNILPFFFIIIYTRSKRLHLRIYSPQTDVSVENQEQTFMYIQPSFFQKQTQFELIKSHSQQRFTIIINLNSMIENPQTGGYQFSNLKNGEILAFRTVGAESHPPLLLVHLYGSSSRVWEMFFPDFGEAFRVIAVDLRGHGKSSYKTPIDDFRDLADDLKLFLDNLGVPKCSVLGWGIGGLVAMSLAIRYPGYVEKLVTVNSTRIRGFPLFQLNHAFQPTDKRVDTKVQVKNHPICVAYSKAKEMKDLSKVREMLAVQLSIGDQNTAPAKFMEIFIEDFLHSLPFEDFLYAVNRFNLSGKTNGLTDATYEIKKLKCKHLMILGPQSPLVVMDNAKEIVKETNNLTRIKEFAGCGHALPYEDPENFIKSVKGFFLC